MEIKLTGKYGGIALIDVEDNDLISKYKWHNSHGYACGKINNKNIRMHVLLMKPPEDMVVDHINKNRLDNRKKNLRIISDPDNSQNQSKRKNATSKYFGVSYAKNIKKFSANITYQCKKYYIGSFDTEIEAAEAFDIYIIQNNMKFKELNFPDRKEELSLKDSKFKKEKTCKYIGVKKYENGYIASIYMNGKMTHLLCSKDPIICAKAYDKSVVNSKLTNRKLNFPEDYPNYNMDNKQIVTFYEKFNDTIIRLLIDNNKNIIALLDKSDYDLVKYNKCYLGSAGYIIITTDTGKRVKLHKFLTNTGRDKIVDHKDNNKINNTRENLRIVDSQAKNNRNKKKIAGTSSNYIGVSRSKQDLKWTASITYNGNAKNLGKYIKEEYAARCRDLHILDNYEDQCYKLNFEWTDEDKIKWRQILNSD